MLSGIRKGKKRKKKDGLKPSVDSSQSTKLPAEQNESKQLDNKSIAAKLRESLASGDMSVLSSSNASSLQSNPMDQLERRGRIRTGEAGTPNSPTDDSSLMVVNLPRISTSTAHTAEAKTIRQMAAEEAQSSEMMSWDEQMARNLSRLGRKRRRKKSRDDDSDEEVDQMQFLLPGHQEQRGSQKAAAKAQEREKHRAIAAHHKQEKITSKCPWWIESSSFSKHRLLALGNHVSLVMAAPNSSLVLGHHFYLVPLKHAESYVSCDDGVWEEVRRFHSSLQNLYAKEYKKDVIMFETVLPNRLGIWQTKIELVPVSFDLIQDAPIYFKSAMVEHSEEFGTHSKLLTISRQKPLRSVVPKKKFPYFFCEWGTVATSNHTGFAQIIESSQFRHDFGVDTIAGMMELEPIRFQRKRKFAHNEELRYIGEFLEKWKAFDWTLQLDGK